MGIFKGTNLIEDKSCLMTIEEWTNCVECGAFIDYDGFGHPSDGVYEDSSVEIYPSERLRNITPGATHIMWYNR